jgi:hypothetical protein
MGVLAKLSNGSNVPSVTTPSLIPSILSTTGANCVLMKFTRFCKLIVKVAVSEALLASQDVLSTLSQVSCSEPPSRDRWCIIMRSNLSIPMRWWLMKCGMKSKKGGVIKLWIRT